MKESELKNILRKNFNFEANWKPLFSLLFSKVQYFSNPSNPFSENEKVKSGKQTGIVKLDDGKSIAIFEVEVDDSIRIDRNRQGLREIAIKHIDQNITHGAFVFFYSKNQADYRFSFIAKWSELDLDTGEFKKGETKPKRYTYLLGDNEACTTAAKRLLILIEKNDKQKTGIKEIIDAFSVESLNKEFFKTYKEHYERFWRFIANPDNGLRDILLDTDETKGEVKREKPIRDFAKKLLGRIVFLHFLQKKGWMGCSANTKKWEDGEKQFMQQLFADFSNKPHFHSQCLTKLFFNTLNTRRPNDIFEINGLNGKLNGSRVPYLNGGLFDADKPEEVLTIDFPERYFAELLGFFEQYNFTIDENSPDDHEVGIDPEMLGHIFENLLEENREKGAFYTPKEVVQYMCKESIVQYLSNSFDAKTDIEKFVRNHFVSETLAIKDNAVLLNELLDEIKVCDPAIGSGAFPIGILLEIFEAKKFIYPYLRTNRAFDPAQVKKDIIQKSIYGVDLEKGAVDIAQLRFWLALVVDEENPHPLPNLDYKIMQGNSLLESFEGIDLSKAALFAEPKVAFVNPLLFEEPKTKYGFSDEDRADIKRLISDYFKIEDKTEKETIRKRIDRIVLDYIDRSLEFYENRLLIEIADYEYRLDGKISRLTDAQKEQYKTKSKEVAEIEKRKLHLANRTEARKKLLDFEHTDERPYFLWHLFFMDVFEKGGFDVIIGNPPYIQLQKMGKEADILQEVGFETFERTGDIYMLFIEKGTHLLNNCGSLVFITNSTWLRTAFGNSLKTFFCKNTSFQKLIDLSDCDLFENAAVLTTIIQLLKGKKGLKEAKGLRIRKTEQHYIKSLSRYFAENSIPINSFLPENAWSILAKEKFKIKEKVEKQGIEIRNWGISIYRGILTGLNEAFVIDASKKDELISEDPKSIEILKPLIRGRDVVKYKVEYADLWLINTHNGVKEKGIPAIDVKKDFPIIYTHLAKYGEPLRTRSDKGMHWSNLRHCAYIEEFEKPKIIFPNMTKHMPFYYDDSGYYTNQKCYIITGEHLLYLTAVFNSKLFEYCFRTNFPELLGGVVELSKVFFERIPIKMADKLTEGKLGEMVLEIIDQKKGLNKTDTRQLERQIDEMVYKLYELTDDEIKAIEDVL